VQGSALTAGRHLTLTADDEIKLLAAANTSDQKSSSKNSSASLGIGFALGGTQNGFTIQAGVSSGRGKANGNDLTWSNSQLAAGKTLTLESGGDTTLRGAVARGEQVVADIGGNLAIESLQDTSTYDSQQKSLGASVSLCIPPFCVGAASTGSVSASNSKIESDYASVTQQSGIKAGDGGFQVAVTGDTDLKGGAITSTQQAIDDNKNRFQTGASLTLTDIHNEAEYTAKSASVNVGTGFSAAGALMPQGTSAGIGQDGGKAESTTLAAISGVAGNKEARTGDAEAGIAKIFDADKVQKEIDAQARITQMFGQSASKAVGDYAQTQTEQARELRRQAAAEPADDRRAALEAEAQRLEGLWGDTGTLRIAAHALIGGLTGGASGAVGAAVGTITAPLVAAELAKAGIDGPLATAITGLASTAAGAAVGGTAGAATALNEVGNNYLKHQEATRLIALRNQKLRGNCDANCNQDIQRLEALDLQRNRDVVACEGVASSHCDGLRTQVRLAAAEYIRTGHITPEFRYNEEQRETIDLAASSMGGIRLADQLAGAGETL